MSLNLMVISSKQCASSTNNNLSFGVDATEDLFNLIKNTIALILQIFILKEVSIYNGNVMFLSSILFRRSRQNEVFALTLFIFNCF